MKKILMFMFALTIVNLSFSKNENLLDINNPDTTKLFGQFYHLSGAFKGAFDLVLNVEKSSSDADKDKDKDMKNIDLAGMGFTGSWSNQNGSVFAKYNNYNFNKLNLSYTDSVFKALSSGGLANANVLNPTNSDVYIGGLRNNNKYYAVIKIENNNPNDNTCGCVNIGKISFSYYLFLNTITDIKFPEAFSEVKTIPNPFHNSFNLEYNLSSDSPVKIEIFNLMGEKIKTFSVDENQYPGHYTYEVNLSNAGIYFVHISDGKSTTTFKMVGVK